MKNRFSKFKGKIAAATVICLIVTLSMPIGASAVTISDISDHWANATIQNWVDKGFVAGYTDGSFKPDNTISRAEFMMLTNQAFAFTEKAPIAYSDVKADAWYAGAVAIAKAAGYISGYPDGTMKPDSPISREEAASIIMKIDKLTADDSAANHFTDSASLVWSKGAVSAVNAAKIMMGYPDGSFGPQKMIKRGEAVVALDKAMKYSITASGSATIDAVDLGTAGNYAILAKAGISSVPNSVVTGNIGVSPVAATFITGFSLTMDATNVFSTSTQVTGKAYAADYTSPTPSNLTTAVSNMETAYTDAAGRAADYTELYSGDISGRTLTAGVYKWGTEVLINTDVTLHGSANDVFIFQVGKGITQANGTKIILTGGIQAKNIFWQSAETVAVGTNAHFEGIILGMKNITLGTNSTMNGRLLAQTAVTLDQSTVVEPN